MIDRLLWFGRSLLREWREDRVPDLAAEVAFYAILSLLPALVALASMLGLLESLVGGNVATRAETEVLDFLGSILTNEADGIVQAVNDLFQNSRPGLLTFSLLAALWTLSRGFAALVKALDVVYDIDEHRGWFDIRLTSLGLGIGSVITAAVMLGLAIIGPLFGSGREIAEEIGLGDQFVFLWEFLRYPVLVTVLLLWAATIFHIAPDHHTPWKWDVPGALVTGALWVVFSFGLRIYLQVAGTGGNAVTGTLGGVFIVMLWFWLLSLAVLVGGEVNEIIFDEWGPPKRSDRVEGDPEAPDEVAGVDG